MIKDGNYITQAALLRFKTWLWEQNLTVNKFAKKCGVSRQYIERVLHGQTKITASVREWFLKGGYELL